MLTTPNETSERDKPAVPVAPQLPALSLVRPIEELRPRRRPRRGVALLTVLLLAAGLAGAYRWLHAPSALPPGIAFSNGRLEADAIDIDTKFAGRIAKLFADEGELVKAGQMVGVMDTRDLEATLKKEQALVLEAEHMLDAARADLAQQQTQVELARVELDRTTALVPRGFATRELLDQRQQQYSAAVAAAAAADQRAAVAQRALDAATHDVEYYKVEISDNALVAPKPGPIEYRVANIGEVLPAGGKVFTMLDAGYVYMDIYLPTAQAGRVRLGSEARIVLDAYPDHVIPAKVVFVASQAQFTPKAVETRDERDKLMFRVRVRIDPARLEGRGAIVRSGLPGMAYVRTDPAALWPANLQPSPAPNIAIAVPPP